MRALKLAAALAAIILYSHSPAWAQGRITNDFTHATEIVDELSRILRIRNTVCPRATDFIGCRIEYGLAITFRIHEYSANMKSVGLWEPWRCKAECKRAEEHLRFLSKKYKKYEVSSTPSPPR